MGELYAAPIPVCPVHGRMRHDSARCAWTCAGWDGEGCDHVVTDEDMAWKHLGTAGPIEWKPDR